MRLAVSAEGDEREVEVVAPADATVADLAAALHILPRRGRIWIDGRPCRVSAPVHTTSLVDGSRIADQPDRWVAALTWQQPVVTVSCVAGLVSGSSLALPPGEYRIGGGDDVFTLSVAGDGTWSIGAPPELHVAKDGATVVGPSCAFRVEPWRPAACGRVDDAGDGRLRFNRQPRARPPEPDLVVTLPATPEPPPAAAPLPWLSALAPLPVAAVMALLLNPLFAMFGLMSPLMLVGGWLEGRRRLRRDRRRHAAAAADAAATLAARLAGVGEGEAERRWRALPTTAELIARARRRDARLWERRVDHADFLALCAGVGCGPLAPELDGDPAAAPADPSVRLPHSPVPVDLAERPAIGIVGPRPLALDLARGLVLQAAALHGPADLGVAVTADPTRRPDWEWVKWLPHLIRSDAGDPHRVLLVVHDRSVPASPVATGGVRTIAIAAAAEDLPAACSTIVRVTTDGTCSVTTVAGGQVAEVLPCGATPAQAAEAARRLAPLDDSEPVRGSGAVPTRVSLGRALGLTEPLSPAWVAGRWAAADPGASLPTTFALGASGPVTVDLVEDGPHGLVAGTTGSGKSELLRALVATLVASVDPERLNLVLVDYKGGGAFDACRSLPHTVAVVTDLDQHLGARALRGLRAEVRRREEILRAADAPDIAAYLGADPGRRLARLVVLIDEFATLAADLPDFLDSLVDLAQRGRSLGLHLILATQRPSGVLDAKIRANTNLRIALRVQDEHDSADVVGVPDAAHIARSQRGRGVVRLGVGDLVAFQAAHVTGPASPISPHAIEVRPFTLAGEADLSSAAEQPPGRTELDGLVDAVIGAAASLDLAEPHRPWLDPLPAAIDAEVLLADHDPRQPFAVPFGLVDRPDDQRREALTWCPADGHLLCYGADPVDRASALSTIALALAHGNTSAQLHVYICDFDRGALGPLGRLPHVGAVVARGEAERTVRLLGHLTDELDRRRALAAADRAALPLVLVLVDGYAALAEELDEADLVPALDRVMRDGAQLGVVVVATASHERSVPQRVAGLVTRKLVFAMADPSAYIAFGLRPAQVPDLGAGRAVAVPGGHEARVAQFAGGDLTAAVAAVPVRGGPPAPAIRTLPSLVSVGDVGPPEADPSALLLPVGIASATLAPTALPLKRGEHAVVIGPPGSGRSSLLKVLAGGASALGVAVSCDGEPGDAHLLVIDDVDRVPAPRIEQLRAHVEARPGAVSVVVSGPATAFREFGSWARSLCGGQTGVLLQPSAAEADLLGVRLPSGQLPLPVGRGLLVVRGRAELVQFAVPGSDDDSRELGGLHRSPAA